MEHMGVSYPGATPSDADHLKLLAQLYRHDITKGASMGNRYGGVADIDMLHFYSDKELENFDQKRYPSEWTKRLEAQKAHALW